MNAPQQIKRVGPDIPTNYYTLPPFSLELKKYGGSVHEERPVIMSGYPGASLYRQDIEMMGFHANGAFTCTSPGLLRLILWVEYGVPAPPSSP